MSRLKELSQALAEGEEEAEINLTPMLDVVFIMLIFFIVTASFLKESGLEANRPPSVQQQPEKSESITVRITSTNKIIIDGRDVDPRAVSAVITRKKAENPDAPIAILAGKRAKTELIVGVIDAANSAGFYGESIPISPLPE
ncbi:MAG: biopolymer transporter ExbD [Gammaproteobacteria bacterium]|nr:MAG: biopolymer transporter ExbD [Gammaproteobacteria bacterium]